MATDHACEQIDSVTLSVINNAFVNVCREMGTAMMRTSYSPIFNEGLDFSCMLFNRGGDLIGQAEFCPTMLGSCAVRDEVDARGGRATTPSSPATSSSTTIPTAASATCPSTGDEAGLPRGRAVGLRRQHRPRRRDRRHGARLLRRRRAPRSTRKGCACRRSRSWPRRVRQGHLADRPRQPPHPEDHLGRLPRHDRLAARRRDAGARAARAIRRGDA